MDYIHFNPVKHGPVASAADWPFSRFARCVAMGVYPVGWMFDWGGVVYFGEMGLVGCLVLFGFGFGGLKPTLRIGNFS